MDGEEVVVPPVCWMDASLDLGPWVGEVCGAPYDWVVSIEVGTLGYICPPHAKIELWVTARALKFSDGKKVFLRIFFLGLNFLSGRLIARQTRLLSLFSCF